MSDIIKDAKQLLDGATPGPWMTADSDIVKESNNKFIGTISEYSGIDFESEESANTRLAAAAPELAALLAEETYLYGVQVWMGAQWIMMLTSNYGISLMHRGRWFVHKHEAEDFAEMWSRATPTRIVRRRVSPPEVINE